MRANEDSPARFAPRASALRQLMAACALLGFGLALASLTMDVLFIGCDRARDQCSFESVGVLQGGRTGGNVKLSEVERWSTEGYTERGGGNRVTRSERHGLRLLDGRRVELEPRSRGVVFDDLLEAQFRAFVRSGEPAFSAWALHFGSAGFAIPVFFTLGCVLLVLALQSRSRDQQLSRASAPRPLALGCMLLALAPLGVGVAWWILNAARGALL